MENTYADETSPDVSEPMFPIGDAARILQVSVDTVRRWEKAGKISAVRTVGGQRRFTQTELHKIQGGAR